MIIPFFIPHAGCPHQCVFCNQKHITGLNKPLDPALISEKIRSYLKTGGRRDAVQVAFYGGSFTALPLQQQREYLEAVRSFVQSGLVSGIRLSTRPDCISRAVLELLKEYSVDTVELGVQSMNDRVLALAGRGHCATHTVTAVNMLRTCSFKIGLQLMPGLPGDSADTFFDTVSRIIALKPDFVRIYPAVVIKDTPLEALYRSGQYCPLSLDDAVALCKNALLRFELAGIGVIRIGLQPTEELEKAGTIIAGPFHPAFRQLVESSIIAEKMASALRDRKSPCPEVKFFVNPAYVSSAIGQKRSNVEMLKKQFGLKELRVQSDPTVQGKSVRLAV